MTATSCWAVGSWIALAPSRSSSHLRLLGLLLAITTACSASLPSPTPATQVASVPPTPELTPSPARSPGVTVVYAIAGAVDVTRFRADAGAVAERYGVGILGVSIPAAGQLLVTFDREPSAALRAAIAEVIALPFLPSRAATAPPPAIATQADAAARRILPSVVILTTQQAVGARGAGFFISSDGYILTNAHVARELNDVLVILYDGRRLAGRVVGWVESVRPDVGVVKVDLADAPAVEFGDSDALQLGQTLLIAGHPGAYGNWLVAGGKLLRSDIQRGSGQFPQVYADMPGAPGDSGGAMFDLRGRVVGLVSGGSLPSLGGVEPAPFGIVWSWTDFQSLRPPDQTTAVAINSARAKAAEIIARRGNVP